MESKSPSSIARVQQPVGVQRWIPALRMLRSYQRAWLSKDLLAGQGLVNWMAFQINITAFAAVSPS